MRSGGETYKPSQHDGLKEDGTPDKRMHTGQFAHGKVDPQHAGQQRGHTGGSPTEKREQEQEQEQEEESGEK